MPTVAEQLRQAREAQNLSVNEVAEIIKIRTDHLRALEEGRYDVFPASVYIRGFVRNYAKLLKLDGPQLISELQQELAQSGLFNEPLARPQGSKGIVDFIMFQLSRMNWRIALPLIAIALIVWGGISTYRYFSHQKSKDPLEGLGSGMYQPAKKDSGQTLPLPDSSLKSQVPDR